VKYFLKKPISYEELLPIAVKIPTIKFSGEPETDPTNIRGR